MSTVARRVVEDLQTYGDFPVTDEEVEQALASIHARVAAGIGKHGFGRYVAVAAAVLASIALTAGAWLALRPHADVPVNDSENEHADSATAPVVEYWSHPLWGHNGFVWVYGDGRAIIAEHGQPFLERRLTPRGLDLLLQRVDGLHRGPTTDKFRHPCDEFGCGNVVSVIEVNGSHYDVSDNEAMADLLFQMEHAVPGDPEWQRKPGRYHPTAYEACYGPSSPPESADTVGKSSLLAFLPMQVRDLLAPKTARPGLGGDALCSILSPQETSHVAAVLDLRPDIYGSGGYDYDIAGGRRAYLIVTVMLPHGVSGIAWG